MTDAITTSQTLTACTTGAPGCPNGDQITTVTTHTTSASKIGGYGHVAANNVNCGVEAAPAGTSAPGSGSCAGDIRIIQEGTFGFWHKMYQGPKGGLRWGLQYSYLTKSGWSGNGGLAAGSAGISPKAVDNVVLTSFRYYLP
jgi:hypothetical protein